VYKRQPLFCLAGEVPGAGGVADFGANFAALRSAFRTFALDPPPASSSSQSPEDAARTLVEVLDGLGIAKASFVGNGIGAATAVHLAVIAPERVDRLVLIGPSGCAFDPFTPPPLEGMKAIAAYWREPSVQHMKEIATFLFATEELHTDAFAEARHAAALGQDPTVQPLATAVSPAADLTLIAHLVGAPTLITWGREDRFSPLDYGLNLTARVKDSQFHMFPRCGHWPQYEKADEFNALALDFLTYDN
jgi:pimeloyl-ACP methyl ester carboxylesterase